MRLLGFHEKRTDDSCEHADHGVMRVRQHPHTCKTKVENGQKTQEA